MPKILLIAAAVLLVISSGFGYLNKVKLDEKQLALTNETAAKSAALADGAKAHAAQKKAEKAALDANNRGNELEASLASATSKVNDLSQQVDDAKKNLTDKDAQIAELNDKVTRLSGMPTPAPATSAEQEALKEAIAQRDELKAVKDGLESQLKGAQSQLAALQKRDSDRDTMISMNGLHGRVLAVDRNWNFVVLDLGNRNGVVANAVMVVQRGASMVGKVRITTVEPSQSIADIVPNTVPAGINVEPGDSVIYPGF
jgi:hypothetical protein